MIYARHTSSTELKKRATSTLGPGETEIGDKDQKRVQLNFSRCNVSFDSTAAELHGILLNDEARFSLATLPSAIQLEIIDLVKSEKNEARKVPETPPTFVVTSSNNYHVFYRCENNKKLIIQIISPFQLASFRRILK